MRALVELHARLLAKMGVELGFNGPTLPSILFELDGVEPIDRSSMNAFEDKAFREAVEATRASTS
jgi:hypothetical protein